MPGPPPVMMKMVSNMRIASSSRKVNAKQHHRREMRQGDRPEGLPGVDAVEFRRLVEIGRDGGQPGEQDDEHERRPLPDVGDDQRDVEPGALGHPADRHLVAEQLAQHIIGGPKGRCSRSVQAWPTMTGLMNSGTIRIDMITPRPGKLLHHRQRDQQARARTRWRR